jgi:hypothetical protein
MIISAKRIGGSGGNWGSISGTITNQSEFVTSWQVTPDNVHFPSEKLVKDSLDGKQASGSYLTGVTADSPLSGAGTSGSHLTVDLSSKQAASAALDSVAGLSWSSGAPLVKMTAAGTFDLDASAYLTVAGVLATEANILASTPSAGSLRYSNDTYKLYLYDGVNWKQLPLNLATRPITPDMGYTQTSDLTGYGDTTITDKTIYNSALGGNANSTEGSIRISGGYFQIYLNGVWNDVVINFVFLESSTENYALEHKPIGFTGYYEVSSGNSVALGLNGLPLTQQYSTSMGTYPVKLEIDGGSF